MKIVTVPNEILHAKAKTVTIFGRKLKKLVDDMTTTLNAQKDPEGVGLAAPQIGISEQIFIMKPTKKGPITACINPEILKHETQNTKHETQKKQSKDDSEAKLEGCLSIPRIWGHVVRQDTVDVRYQDLDGKWIEKKFSGFEAVIVQHEIDHLNGILFTQRVLEQTGKLYRERNGELEKYEI